MLTAAHDQVELSDLQASAERLAELQRALERAQTQHDRLIHQAVHEGTGITQVAAAAGVTAGRVRLLARRHAGRGRVGR